MAGRPRSPGLEDRIAGATVALLAEVGYAATTVDAIATRSGVPKSTLYRRWSSKPELVFAVTVHPAGITVPDTGSLAGDLAQLCRRITDAFGGARGRRVLPGLLADLVADPALMQRFQTESIGAERALVRLVLDRATGRGELAGPVDAVGLHAQLLGTAFAWSVLIDEPGPADLPDRMAAAALAALTTGA